MPEFYTWTILVINQLGEIGEKQFSVFGSRGGQISPWMHVPLLEETMPFVIDKFKSKNGASVSEEFALFN